MDHLINYHTIARTPQPKKCFTKLMLKKKSKHKDENLINKDDNDELQSKFDSFSSKITEENLTSTPSFVNCRRVFYKNSPIPLSKDSDSSAQTTNTSSLRLSNNGNLSSNNTNSFKEELKTDENSKISDSDDIVPSYIKEDDEQLQKSNSVHSEKGSDSFDGNITPDMANLMDDLYGKVWRSTPGLFRKKKVSMTKSKGVEKDLDFDLVDKFENLDVKNDAEDKVEVKENILTELNNDSKVETYLDNDDSVLKKKCNSPTVDKCLKPSKLDFGSCDKNDDKENDVNVKKIKKKETKSKRDEKRVVNDYVSVQNIQLYGFMASLADNVPSWRRCEKAKQFIDNFKSKKEELASILFKKFNKNVFESKLPSNLPILWSASLQKTAGRAHNKIVRSKDKTLESINGRRSKVELSIKVVDNTHRLRDTLAHELCHVATWLIDGQLHDGHGPTWKSWVNRVLRRYPEIGSLPVRHSLSIHFKYSYKCIKCGYKIDRHSKSIDVTKKCCGFCRGKFECIINKKTKDGLIVSMPAQSRKATGFALYVKENYNNVRGGSTPHKEAMKYLSKQYAKMKMDKDTHEE